MSTERQDEEYQRSEHSPEEPRTWGVPSGHRVYGYHPDAAVPDFARPAAPRPTHPPPAAQSPMSPPVAAPVYDPTPAPQAEPPHVATQPPVPPEANTSYSGDWWPIGPALTPEERAAQLGVYVPQRHD